MAKRNEKNNISLGWGSGETDLFLTPSEGGSVELLDYEYDYEKSTRCVVGGYTTALGPDVPEQDT